MTIALIGFAILLLIIIVVRIPIAFAMGIVGFAGFAYLQGLSFDNMMTFN